MNRRILIAVIAGGAVAVFAGLAVLYFFDPTTHSFYPLCPLHETTGLLCPGCGTLRALHQLTHGNFLAAWGFNPFIVLMLPLGGWLALREGARVFYGRQWPGLVTHPIFGWFLLAAFLTFGVLRNVVAR